MDDNDLIRRGDALAAVQLGDTVTKMQARIRAIPSVDADPVCTDCGGTGITYQTERRCACQPALTPASDGRAEALREAAEIVEQMMGEWAAATYQNPEARMQNAAKTYAAGDIMNAILARATKMEKTDGQA